MPCMLEFLFNWELYCIVLGDQAWKCLYASVHGLHSVKFCIKWKREYWYSMYNLIFFPPQNVFLQQMFYSFQREKVFFTTLALHRGSFNCLHSICMPFIFCICCPLDIHCILFHYIHVCIWFLCVPLIIFMFPWWSFITFCALCQS